MPIVGYHASHEQFAPSELLRHAIAAEHAGFTGAMCSDHLLPWTPAQGQSGFAWSWLGAAMQATSLPFGIITAPGYRYHPTIVAQAAATLGEMFPDRFWVGVGSGERLNEHVTGEAWPMKSERNARMRECVDVMRALWAGETVDHRGRIIVEGAKLYTRPKTAPKIIGAALTPKTAEWLGGFADGLVTVHQSREKLRAMIDAFRRGGGEGKPLFLQVKISYAKDDAEALRSAHEQWSALTFQSEVLAELRMPSEFESLSQLVRPDEMTGSVRISADLARHTAMLQEDLAMGFETLMLHNVNREQARFIDDFGARVLPELLRST